MVTCIVFAIAGWLSFLAIANVSVLLSYRDLMQAAIIQGSPVAEQLFFKSQQVVARLIFQCLIIIIIVPFAIIIKVLYA